MLGLVFGLVFHLPIYADPLVARLSSAALPFLWLLKREAKRIKKFVDAMPEAVELISRALRAGHGLASGLHLVAEEMKGPIADEFDRVFEEQNLGIPIELSLRNMADRIPVDGRPVLRDRGHHPARHRRRPGRGPRQDRPADPPAVRAARATSRL